MSLINCEMNVILTWSPNCVITGQGDDYIAGYLLDYPYLKKYYKTIAIDLGKQQALNADLKAIQTLNLTGNLDQQGTMFFSLLKKRKKPF